MLPKEIQNIVWAYYQSYNVYELNQDFKASYHWDDLTNCGLWKNGCRINFYSIKETPSTRRNILTWRNIFTSHIPCISFVNKKRQDYGVSPRYFTTLIESDLTDSQRDKILINKG